MRENLPPAPGEAIAAAAEQEYHKDDDDDCCGVHGGETTTNRAASSTSLLPPRHLTPHGAGQAASAPDRAKLVQTLRRVTGAYMQSFVRPITGGNEVIDLSRLLELESVYQ
jgi:hypothetical protein